MHDLLSDKDLFFRHVSRRLQGHGTCRRVPPDQAEPVSTASVVMFLLNNGNGGRHQPEPCLILNKRSAKVRQPGDLCCPGGGIEPRMDALLARLLRLPGLPLAQWPEWPMFRRNHPGAARVLALRLATGLRESFEEMRLNPFGVRFLGCLPVQRLILFQREIYPVVGWVTRQQRYFPNWEVASVIHIPLRCLLEPQNYARYRLRLDTGPDNAGGRRLDDFPCFCHRNGTQTEMLWGATYRIVMAFMQSVFDFRPPDAAALPVVNGRLDQNYTRGRR